MIGINKGNLLKPTVSTDANGFSLFEKSKIGENVILIEGTFPADTLFEVHFKGQSETPTPLFLDYENNEKLILNKCGKIVLSKSVEGLEFGVKVTDALGSAKAETAIEDLYIGLY